jgi:RNA polymerase sigma-70 factor, ECF subfamily
VGVREQATVPPATLDQVVTEDQRLVAAIQRKDRKATAELVSRYADAIYRYVYSRLVPRTDRIDDLVQEVFLAAWENLSEYRGASSLESWLVGIARHKVEDYYRARLREPEPLEETEQKPSFLTRSPDFDDVLDSELVRKKTWQVLARLPEKYRVVLLWRYWDKCSAREMAARTGKTEKAIERLLARARQEFRWMWNHE